ncbi:hypothetical protein GEMRC1_007040 [Eukaryota sp. GEM-RC1]
MTTLSCCLIVFTGCEPIEAFTAVDVLSRAGVDVTIASLEESSSVTTAHGIEIRPKTSLSLVNEVLFDCVIVPGGPGATKPDFYHNSLLHSFLKKHESNNRLIGAICAAPITLAEAGLLEDRRATCYPAIRDKVEPKCRAYAEDKVVICNNVVTSRGPGTALLFALSIARLLVTSDKANKIAADMLCEEFLQ